MNYYHINIFNACNNSLLLIIYYFNIQAASDWLYIYPQGIFKVLVYIKDVYNVPLIYIAENGEDPTC